MYKTNKNSSAEKWHKKEKTMLLFQKLHQCATFLLVAFISKINLFISLTVEISAHIWNAIDAVEFIQVWFWDFLNSEDNL